MKTKCDIFNTFCWTREVGPPLQDRLPAEPKLPGPLVSIPVRKNVRRNRQKLGLHILASSPNIGGGMGPLPSPTCTQENKRSLAPLLTEVARI